MKYDILSLCAPGREIIMQIKDMPARERPQEKLMFAGPGSLSNAELLALVIRTGTSEKSAVQLAEEVIAFADNAAGGLGKADAKELTCIDGIGVSKACSIVAAVELSKRLIAGGYKEDTPAAIIYKATWPDEKRIICTLKTMADEAEKAGVRKTAVVLVGNVIVNSGYERSKLYDPSFTTEFRQAKE